MLAVGVERSGEKRGRLMTEAQQLAGFGLKKCSLCQRILPRAYLKGDRCADTTDCILARQLAWLARSGFEPSRRELEWLAHHEERENGGT